MNDFRQFAIAAVGGAAGDRRRVLLSPAFATWTGRGRPRFRARLLLVPWTAKTKFFKWPAREGPVPHIALASEFIASTWRIQMIKTAKAFAAARRLPLSSRSSRLSSTGEDVASRKSRAINNVHRFRLRRDRRQRSEPIGVQACSHRRANDAGVILVAFDQHSSIAKTPSTSTSTRRPGVWPGAMASTSICRTAAQGPRNTRRLRHLGRPRPSTASRR